jgi:hypothetical protein
MTVQPTPKTTRRASDVLYDEVAGSRNSLRRENIRLIKDVCDWMEKDKVPISVAEVVRRCGTDGPAYSTVSNQGSQLGEYIRLRIAEQTATPRSTGSAQSIADSVYDPVLQARIRDTESTARWVTRENDGLRALLKSLRPGIDIDGLIRKESDATETTKPQPLTPSPGPDSNELRGLLLKLMDHLVSTRQYKGTRGRLTVNGKIVLDARELKIYREASGLAEEAWQTRYGEADQK